MNNFILGASLAALVSIASCRPGDSVSHLADDSAVGAFEVGVAKRDITGPALGLGTLGYAAPTPKASGIRQRLFARAFVIKEAASEKRVALVVLDTAFISWGVKALVIEELKKTLGDAFNSDNVMLTATHTHSAPGAYSNNHYYNIPFGGLSRQNLAIIVQGVSSAIAAANQTLVPANIKLNAAELVGANINRSPFAYQNNPAAERARYKTSTDTESTQLTFTDEEGRGLGLFNWFAVHATSVKKDNTLLNGDNKGYAAAVAELGAVSRGEDSFVAGFPSKASGDASPNTAGGSREGGEWSCPLMENYACAALIGGLMAGKAEELRNGDGLHLKGLLDYRASFIELEQEKIAAAWSEGNDAAATCSSAVGTAMIAGSGPDGPGVGKEGRTCSEATGIVRRMCQINKCHGEKIVALKTGTQTPKWIDSVLPIQIIRIGSLAILAAPGEYTTMAGRRLENTVQSVLAQSGVKKTILMAYANDYAGYTTTKEEYQLQYYEGGHTLFGEWQLAAYQQNFSRLAEDMVQGAPSQSEAAPKLRYSSFKEADTYVGKDSSGDLKFGDLISDVKPRYAAGQTAALVFVGANPNNNLMMGGSFFEVQVKEGAHWTTVRTDNSWDTAVTWKSKGGGRLDTQIDWMIPQDTAPETYRIVFRGVSKMGQTQTPFSGISRDFAVE